MSFWPQFWMWVLLFGLAVFCGLAVVVSIGGVFDIRALFRSIRRQHDQQKP
jgi:hypothetical protein